MPGIVVNGIEYFSAEKNETNEGGWGELIRLIQGNVAK